MRKLFSVVLIAMLLLSALPSTKNVIAQSPDPDSSAVSIDAAVMQEMETKGVSSYWVEFESSISTLNAAQAQDMNWSEQGWYVYETLSAAAKKSQAEMIKYLTAEGIPFQSFWIKNTILVEESDLGTLNQIAKFAGVTSIEGRKDYILYEPEREPVLFDNSTQSIEPNLSHVNADDVWALGIDGAGVVVANIDTGVRYSHQALVNQYRGNQGDGTFEDDYNWFDPYGDHDSPADDNGHGSHTMGTMVGDDGGSNQIGMAPNAQWMACRGCSTSDCTDTALLSCGQFITAPTTVEGEDANPDMRPNVVNNSWGDCSDEHDPWYDDVIDAWHAAGIYPVFSNGNASNCSYSAPPGLNTVGSPARNGSVTGVGSSGEQNGLYATHSNWGPTDDPDTVNAVEGFEDLKPQVIAPGVSIRSSTPGSDTDYEDGWSGTSMSAPHVSGLVALMWQAAPCLVGDYATTETFIEQTANPVDYDDGTTGAAHTPNYATGWGEIDALAAVQAVTGYCTMTTVGGTITDASTGAPIDNARIALTAEGDASNNRIAFTNENGQYIAYVDADTYDMVVTKFGYGSNTVEDIVVEEDDTPITLDLALTPLPVTTLSGVVSDGGVVGLDSHGYPLYAELTFSAMGDSTVVTTNPFDGSYSVQLYQDLEYTVSVSSLILGGYEDYSGTYTGTAASATQDYELFVSAVTCGADGYEMVGGLFEDFEAGVLPAGWENHDYDGGGQVWEFDDPDGRGNLTPNGTGGFAILDSDAYGYGNEQDAGLRTPALDFTDVAVADLSFESYFRYWGDSIGSVRVSTDNGTSWSTLWSQTATTAESVSIDLSDYAGEASVMIEFLYVGDYDYYWEVDNVLISTGDCQLVPGGIVAGYVEDEATGDAFVGAIVSSADVEVQTMDLAEYPGLYLTFQPTTADPEDVDFTASYGTYTDAVETVSVAADAVTRQDFELASAVLTVDPASFEETLPVEGTSSKILTISNTGSADGDFTLFELQASLNVDTELALDDGTADDSIGLTNGGQFIWFNRFTPDASAFPITLEEVTAIFNDSVSVGDQMQVVIYTDDDGDPDTGADYIGGETFAVTDADLTTWNSFVLSEPIQILEPCDILIGLVNRSGVLGYVDHPAAIDDTSSAGRSWVGAYSEEVPAEPDLPTDDLWGTIDSVGFPGNWMIRGVGTSGSDDIVWLSVDSETGTVAAGESVDVSVNFDAAGLAAGDYTARLLLQQPVHSAINIPVTLHVTTDNVAPVAVADAYSVVGTDELAVAAPGVLSNDTDVNGDTLTAVLDTDVLNGTLVLNSDGSFTYIADEGFVGADTFTYMAFDGEAYSDAVTVTITVTSIPVTGGYEIYLPLIVR